MSVAEPAWNFGGSRYISLVTFRKNGDRVPTPVWFAEHQGKLYVMTRSDSGKMKRIRNNPRIEIAPCTIRGKPLGKFLPGTTRMAGNPVEARRQIRKKYLLARIPFLWSRNNIYLEITTRDSDYAETV
jgi:PPOX class probable F420-dependent enzyme